MQNTTNLDLDKLIILFQETGKRIDQLAAEANREMAELRRTVKEQSKQIGAVTHSIGNLNEGLTFPSLAHELETKFNMQFVGANVDKKIDGKKLELDVLAYSNGTLNQVMIVEIKTNLTSTAIKQLESNVKQFREFFPEHNDKVVYGVIAASKAREKEIKAVLNAGFYFAAVNEGLFSIQVPKGFKPKAF